MQVDLISSKLMCQRIRKFVGSWQEIIIAAGKEYGERGRMFAVLHQPKTLKGSTEACENLLKQAGLGIDRVLQMTRQGRTLSGLRAAIALEYNWLETDVCPNFLKEGVCSEEGCTLKHKIPEKVSG